MNKFIIVINKYERNSSYTLGQCGNQIGTNACLLILRKAYNNYALINHYKFNYS